MGDPRPEFYLYYNQLLDHIEQKSEIFKNRIETFPRQFEIHLPSNHIRSCNLACSHCAGRLFDKTLGTWELDGLDLLNQLSGKIPYHIYGGAYTEPIMNPYLLSFIATTKRYGNHFGIHTNGVFLYSLEKEIGLLTELNRLSTDSIDYLSVSIDAGTSSSWANSKKALDPKGFTEILKGLDRAMAIKSQKNTSGHAIRLCYLISPETGTEKDFKDIVEIAKILKVDSLRFSIPFASYNQTFDTVRSYKKEVEIPKNTEYYKMLKGYLSDENDKTVKPYIFYSGPEFTDIDRYTFKDCFYNYYQITLGADGYFYKCSTVATPTAKHCRVGKLTNDYGTFMNALMRNNKPWNCQGECFDKGLRCNRMGVEINEAVNWGL